MGRIIQYSKCVDWTDVSRNCDTPTNVWLSTFTSLKYWYNQDTREINIVVVSKPDSSVVISSQSQHPDVEYTKPRTNRFHQAISRIIHSTSEECEFTIAITVNE